MKVIPLILSFLIIINVNSQDFPRKEFDGSTLADELFPAQQLDVSYQELYESTLTRLSSPLDLNSASDDDLRGLYVLKESEVQAILRHRKESGDFLSVYELQSVGLDPAVIYKLIPFVTVRDLTTTIDRSLLKRMLEEKNNYLILRTARTVEQAKGYHTDASKPSGYAGSPEAWCLRFRINRPGDFSIGLTTEKDAGEKFAFRKDQAGMDHYSFHLQLQRKGWINNLVVGDYMAQFGQGLVLGGGFGMGKGSETITTLRRVNAGFSPYTSVGESGYFHGLGSSLLLSGNITAHLFVSTLAQDAVSAQDTSDYSFISSFAISGLHRTPAEVASRHQVREWNQGGVLQYRHKEIEAGIIVHHTAFSLPVTKNPTPYNQFAFHGQHNTNTGFFINYSVRNFSFFSELANTFGAGTAFVGGVLASATPKLDVSLLLRSYAKDFHAFYSNAIAENTTPQNEKGVYWGYKYAISRKYSLSGYADLFMFPWLRYRSYIPGAGNEWMMRLTFTPTKTASCFLQLRQESRQGNVSDAGNLYLTGSAQKYSTWINVDYTTGLRLSFKTRVQLSELVFANKVTRGSLVLQDVTVKTGRLTWSGRYCLFHTDDYDNRIYVYEKDVPMSFSFPAFFGSGVHQYVMLRWQLSRKFDLWCRWSHIRYTDRDTIGSGGETINGNVRNDLKLQVRWRLADN